LGDDGWRTALRWKQCRIKPERIIVDRARRLYRKRCHSDTQKKHVPVENLEILLSGTVRDEHPQIFTDVNIEYVFYGDDINAIDVERAIELSTTKYCSISAMLKPTVTITHSYRIESPHAVAQPHEAVNSN
jgi:hypothetical protein